MANFEKFYARLRGTCSDGAINVVCLGDSVTHGCFAPPQIGFEVFDSYTMKLRRALGFLYPSLIFNVINSGIGGDTAPMGLARFDRDVLAYHPDLVIIAFGVNDHTEPDAYIAALGTMFDKLNELGIPVIYMTQHMMNTYVDAAHTEEKYLEYAAVTAEKQNSGAMTALFASGIALAKEKNIAVCDVQKKWQSLYDHGVDITRLLSNRINHPCPEMHDLFVWSILETLFFDN